MEKNFTNKEYNLIKSKDSQDIPTNKIKANNRNTGLIDSFDFINPNIQSVQTKVNI